MNRLTRAEEALTIHLEEFKLDNGQTYKVIGTKIFPKHTHSVKNVNTGEYRDIDHHVVRKWQYLAAK
tara:strand:+ start:3129 stop:3329 length:201 start_codon:yes stop_codon:yes gene_type:complete